MAGREAVRYGHYKKTRSTTYYGVREYYTTNIGITHAYIKINSRVQFSRSAHTRRDFLLHKKIITNSGKRESAS